jgi:hypothetical protein
MPLILECLFTTCAYNRSKECHATAITVGTGNHPLCDTFIRDTEKGGFLDLLGSVGACKEAGCLFNQALECTAACIHVKLHADHPDCSTYAPRESARAGERRQRDQTAKV